MKSITPAAANRSKQVLYEIKLKEELTKYIKTLCSLDELTFNIGVIINQMESAGMRSSAICDALKKHDRFKEFKDQSLRQLVFVWGRGVHHLIKDYGRGDVGFAEVKKNLLNDHNIQLTSHIIRNYHGDIAICLQSNSTRASSIKEIYKDLDEGEAVESMSEMVESVNQASHDKREERIKVTINKPVQPVRQILPYEGVVAEFINIKTIPAVKSALYIRFMRVLSCCRCDEKKASDVLKLDAEYLPMSSDDSDLLCVPMCVSCKMEVDSGTIKLTQSEKSMMLFKYPSIFLQAMVTNLENKIR